MSYLYLRNNISKSCFDNSYLPAKLKFLHHPDVSNLISLGKTTHLVRFKDAFSPFVHQVTDLGAKLTQSIFASMQSSAFERKLNLLFFFLLKYQYPQRK